MKSKIVLCFLLILFAAGCGKMKNYIEPMDKNSIVTNGQQKWDYAQKITVINQQCTPMELAFINNPYMLNDSVNICLYIDDNTLIYRGKYLPKLSVCIPDSLFNKTTYPALQVFKDDKTFEFMGKGSSYINKGEKYLGILFKPENGLVGSCVLKSGKESFKTE